jgi:hypothetical protein
MFLNNRATTAIFSTIFALGFVSLETSVKAQDPPQRAYCTNRLLQGDYGAQFSGFGSSGAPVNLVFLYRFNGNGNVIGVKGAFNSGGNISEDLSDSDTGTYQVNSDCTVTISFVFSPNQTFRFFGVVVNNGKKVLVLETNPGANFAGTLEKVEQRELGTSRK